MLMISYPIEVSIGPQFNNYFFAIQKKGQKAVVFYTANYTFKKKETISGKWDGVGGVEKQDKEGEVIG